MSERFTAFATLPQICACKFGNQFFSAFASILYLVVPKVLSPQNGPAITQLESERLALIDSQKYLGKIPFWLWQFERFARNPYNFCDSYTFLTHVLTPKRDSSGVKVRYVSVFEPLDGIARAVKAHNKKSHRIF